MLNQTGEPALSEKPQDVRSKDICWFWLLVIVGFGCWLLLVYLLRVAADGDESDSECNEEENGQPES